MVFDYARRVGNYSIAPARLETGKDNQ
jgi:hypothetical protein